MNGNHGRLFVYGTLLCEDIFLQVAGCRCRRTPAWVAGYRRLRVRGEEYPGMVPADGFRVEGVVYHVAEPVAWERLDRFEGEMYERRRVETELADGTIRPADAYIVRPQFRDLLEPVEWRKEDFLRSGKGRFQDLYLEPYLADRKR